MNKTKVVALFNSLIEFSSRFSGGQFNNNDTTEHFIRYYFSKLLDQSSSFLLLYLNNKSDAMLIARSIIEGFSLLIYTKENPELYTSRWLRYSNIEAYRYISDLKKNGINVDIKIIKQMEDYIENNCSEFIIKRGYGLHIKSKLYCNNWYYPLKITQIINQLDSSMIKIAYNEYSNWHHWGPLSRINTLGKDGSEYYFKEHEGLENSILIVFFCLINTTSIVINLFGKNEELEVIRKFEKLMSNYVEEA